MRCNPHFVLLRSVVHDYRSTSRVLFISGMLRSLLPFTQRLRYRMLRVEQSPPRLISQHPKTPASVALVYASNTGRMYASALTSAPISSYESSSARLLNTTPGRRLPLHTEQPLRDTIYAVASGSGRCGVTVVRISGPSADAALRQMITGKSFPQPRLARLYLLRHPGSLALLDRALVLRFPGPNSFTGEDVVELHLHGSPAVVHAVLEVLGSLPGLRAAQPGEFTRRAFYEGKMDLIQLESAADLLSADTEAQRLQALELMVGKQSSVYARWRSELLSCLANIEAVLDFGEDAELGNEVALSIVPRVAALRREVDRSFVNGSRGQLVRDGLKAVLLGPTNAGKSSILNLVAGRDAAIVSPHPGTTRDIVEVPLELGGYKVLLSDSAGIRSADNPVEAEGISRAIATARLADILVVVVDASAILYGDGMASSTLDFLYLFAAGKPPEDRPPITAGEDSCGPVLLVLNKVDLLDPQALHEVERVMAMSNGRQAQGSIGGNVASKRLRSVLEQVQMAGGTGNGPGGIRVVALSCRTGRGADNLAEELCKAAEALVGVSVHQSSHESVLITRHRHRQHLQQCVSALLSYQVHVDEMELAAEDLRAAARALGSITSAIDAEEILESIFTEFCIGK